jgi:uncharacterized membrane protein YeaQ/YmgE (transglycosylase-associated protein family)
MDTPLFIIAIIFGGFVLGSIARFIVPGRQPFSLAETTIMGMLGAAIGATIVNAISGTAEFDRLDLASTIGAVAGSVLVIGIATVVADLAGWHKETATVTAAEIIAGGESAVVEFKSTARWNVHTGARDDRMELVIAKTVAGFLNAEGGTLIIGVDDDGTALGLDDDLSLMKAPDHDRYELWLTDHLERCLGKPALQFVTVTFEPYAGTHVVMITIEPSDGPVFVDEPKGGRTADFYVRMGNSTRRLLTDEFAEYQRSRWK